MCQVGFQSVNSIDVPFTNGTIEEHHGLNTITEETLHCDDSSLLRGGLLTDSVALRTAMLTHFKSIELTSYFDKECCEIEFLGEEYDAIGDLFIRNFPNLSYFYMPYSIFESVRSLTIADNPNMEYINIEQEEGRSMHSHPFYFRCATSLTIENRFLNPL